MCMYTVDIQVLNQNPLSQAVSVQIHIDDVSCIGSEDQLSECDYSTDIDPECIHNHNAGVICQSKSDISKVEHIKNMQQSNTCTVCWVIYCI